MELRFFGRTYSSFNHRVSTIATEHQAHFLGQTYTIQRPILTFKPQLCLKKYRGVVYGNNQQNTL